MENATAKYLARRAGITEAQLDALIAAMKDELRLGRKVVLENFLTLEPYTVKPQSFDTPIIGKRVVIGERRRVKLRHAKAFILYLNPKGDQDG